MNFKERGITLGDLLIFIIVCLIAFFAISKIRSEKSQKSLSFFSINNIHADQYKN